jgi:AbrB family looped-hinge helix DNA binding protein
MSEATVKITRNYQMTIPSSVRIKAGVKEGDVVKVVYDEKEEVIKVIPKRKEKLTIKIGKKISVEEIEKAVYGLLDEATS